MSSAVNANNIFQTGNDSDWIREQLVLKYRKIRHVSTFVDLRGLYQSKRDHQAESEQYGVSMQHQKFPDIGKIDY